MRKNKSIFIAALVSIVPLLTPTSSHAQAVTQVKLTGTVVDERGAPVADVPLILRRSGQTVAVATSREAGQFDFGSIPSGTLFVIVHRMGYKEVNLQVDVDPGLTSQTVKVDLIRVAANLDPLVVEESSGRLHEFVEHRKSSKFGHFYDQKQIKEMAPRYVSELFRKVPGARLVPTSAGGAKLTLRGCRPKIWVDGVQAQDAEIDDLIIPSEIAGIEIYPSWAGTPSRYMDRQNRACGAVLIWSRQS